MKITYQEIADAAYPGERANILKVKAARAEGLFDNRDLKSVALYIVGAMRLRFSAPDEADLVQACIVIARPEVRTSLDSLNATLEREQEDAPPDNATLDGTTPPGEHVPGPKELEFVESAPRLTPIIRHPARTLAFDWET